MRRYFIIILVLISLGIQAQNLRKGPYLIYTGNTSEMKLLWQLDTTAQCTLMWGLDSMNLNNIIISNETGDSVNQHQHIYLIDNLNANQKYFYTIESPNDTVSSYFLSAQDSSNTETVFFAYGDTRSYPASQDSVCSRILQDISQQASSQTFLLHAGDWTSNDEEASWNNEFFNRNYANNIELQSKLPLMGCRGNHEGAAIQYNKYWQYNYNYSSDYYSFDYGLVHIAIVDLYVDFTTGSEQLTWLQNDLASSNKIWKFVMVHEPAYTDTSAHKNNIDVQDFIVPVCKQNDVQLIFAGHNHYYAHCLVDSIHHLTIGGGGAPLYTANGVGIGVVMSENTLHYVKIKATPTQAIFEIKRPDNTLVETISLDATIGIDNINTSDIFKIFVSNNFLMINKSSNKKTNLTIYNSLGKTVFTDVLYNKQNQINISNLQKGVYFVNLKNKTEDFTQKVIISY